MSEKIDPSQTHNALPTLRALGFGELLDTTFSLYRTHFWSFLGIASVYFIAMGIGVSICFFDDSAGRAEMITIWVPTVVAVFGVSLFVVSGLVFATAQAYLGKSIRMGVVLGGAGRQFFRCFVGSLIYAVLAALLTALLTLPLGGIVAAVGDSEPLTIALGLFALLVVVGAAVWFLTYWCFFAAAVLVEGKPIWAGMRRRRELFGHTRWRIFGMMFALLLLSFLVGVVFRTTFALPLTFTGLEGLGDFFDNVRWMVFWELPTQRAELSVSHVLMYLINLGIDTFTLPIWVIGFTLLYFDQRIRKEGFDIEVMAARQGE